MARAPLRPGEGRHEVSGDVRAPAGEGELWKRVLRRANSEAEARKIFDQAEAALDTEKETPVGADVRASRTIRMLGEEYLKDSMERGKQPRTLEQRESRLREEKRMELAQSALDVIVAPAREPIAARSRGWETSAMASTPTTGLADDVLPLIRNRSDLHRWSAANAHGRDMHEAIDILEQDNAAGPAERYAVTHKALASVIKVIARADDSSGIIGDACRRLLELHPRTAAAAQIKPAKLIDWMIEFQFDDNDVDYFELDVVAYAEALGDEGVAAYRRRLNDIEASLGQRPSREDRWQANNSHAWFTLDWNAKRLAVLDRDIDAIIRTHVGDRKVAAWFTDTAEAFEEIGEYDLAIDWTRQATEFGLGHQSVTAARHWAKLIDTHRPAESLDTRVFLFRRWPNPSTASELHRAAGDTWPTYRDEVMEKLSHQPYDAVTFTLNTLNDPQAAWDLAHDLCLDSDYGWADLANAYGKIDPLAVLPIHERLVRNELTDAGAEHYRRAAKRLAGIRKLAPTPDSAAWVDALISDLREEHKRRPRLQQEFTRAGLP